MSFLGCQTLSSFFILSLLFNEALEMEDISVNWMLEGDVGVIFSKKERVIYYSSGECTASPWITNKLSNSLRSIKLSCSFLLAYSAILNSHLYFNSSRYIYALHAHEEQSRQQSMLLGPHKKLIFLLCWSRWYVRRERKC